MANSDKYVHGEKNDFPLQRIWKLSVSVKAERIEFYPFQNAPNYNFTKYFSGTPYTYLIDLDQEPNYIPITKYIFLIIEGHIFYSLY